MSSSQQCRYQYIADHKPCAMVASAGSDLCVWHNASLDKSDVYVAILLAQVIEMVGLANGDLCEYHLSELDWPAAELSNTCLDGVDLRDAHMPKANLSNTSLQNANLRRCNLRKANLRGCDLSGCDLKQTDLFGADLTGANLSRSQLDQTNLLNANLSNVNFAGVHVESFQWNERTNFDNAYGLDPQQSDSDETQTFLTPIALANYKKSSENKRSSSVLRTHDQVLQTHTYSSTSSSASLSALKKVSELARSASQVEEQSTSKIAAALSIQAALSAQATQATAAAQKTGESVTSYTIPMQRQRSYPFMIWISAAAVLITMSATAYAAWASYQLSERPVIHKEIVVNKEVIKYIEKDPTPVTEKSEYKQLLQQQQTLVKKNHILNEANRKNEYRLQHIQQENTDLELHVARLSVHNDDMLGREIEHQKLQKKYTKLLRHSTRLNDTASILAKGVDQLGAENSRLNEMKDIRLNTRSQLELLQTKSLQLQHENDQLKKDNLQIQEHNQNILAELSNSRKTLERFLSRIEGSRLHAFLTKDASQLKAIPVKANAPIVLTGDHLITLEISRTSKKNHISSKLFVQRSAHDSIPDVNIIYYDSDMKAIRSISYGFPGSEAQKESFSLSTAQFNSNVFPSFVRILVNPGVDSKLIAQGNSNRSRSSSMLPQ